MRRAALLLTLVLAARAACAGVYEHVDPVSGMTILNNVAPTARQLALAAPAAAPATPAAAQAFPRVSSALQNQRDGARRDILASELETERQALASATATRAASDVLARHTANVAALQRELGRVR
ncbi:hypothetical protein [Massilia sp. S19_KUP03_FR1]|uniref:hypothetical protein n=1 Tax=Massilia sp. S19_KUP03_FR1 TaxID=3025503 RepID=UPI002FCCD866